MKSFRRTLLFVPAKEKMIAKVRSIASDAFIFDLEDSVDSGDKAVARKLLVENFSWIRELAAEVLVRINPLDTQAGRADLAVIPALEPDGLVLPKEDEKAVSALSAVLDAQSAHTSIIPLIESAYGVCHIRDIIGSSGRVNGVIFGAEDFTADMGLARSKDGSEIEYARHVIALECIAAGIEAYDTPYLRYEDAAGLEEDAKAAKRCGMKGKACIHPRQLETVRLIFQPTSEEIAYADELVRTSKQMGTGAYAFRGQMVDAATIKRAQRILEINESQKNE